jgi:hypothetical protein
MSRILPSQAVEVIDRLCAFAADPTKNPTLDYLSTKGLAGILGVVDGVPEELLAVDATDLAALTEARATIRSFIAESHARGSGAKGLPGSYVTTVRRILVKCPDHVVPASVATLAFITDPDLRAGLRSDIASVETSQLKADWKPATVMAGSVIEALLLWALQQQPAAAVSTRVTALVTAKTISQPASALESWNLHQYIEVAAALNIIKADTTAQLRIAKDFRNLIHPGRAIRLKTKCDKGTALAAAAALEFVIRDLT